MHKLDFKTALINDIEGDIQLFLEQQNISVTYVEKESNTDVLFSITIAFESMEDLDLAIEKLQLKELYSTEVGKACIYIGGTCISLDCNHYLLKALSSVYGLKVIAFPVTEENLYIFYEEL